MPKKKTDELPSNLPAEGKKRGRRPKEATTLISSTDKTAVESDNIIIHLPIKTEKPDSQNYMTNEVPQYAAVMNEPTGFDNAEEIHGSSINSPDAMVNVAHLHEWGTEPISNFNDVLDKLKRTRQTELDTYQNKVQRRSVEKCLIQFDECNKSQTWPTMTNISCWWCCHAFARAPCALPVEYVDDRFYVFGVFCSPECAAAYNFNDLCGFGDKWERYTLLNMMYRRIYNENSVRIKLAAPRQVLKKFGGHLTIEEFRANNIDQINTYKFIMPPMTSLIPIQEMTAMDKGFHTKTLERKPVPDDAASYSTQVSEGSSATEGLRLKRSKPLKTAANALERHMLVSAN